MNEMSQLASAMATLVFAAGMLIAEQLYIESRSASASIPMARIARNVSREPLMHRTDFRQPRPLQVLQSHHTR
jgi:hypothetical protein